MKYKITKLTSGFEKNVEIYLGFSSIFVAQKFIEQELEKYEKQNWFIKTQMVISPDSKTMITYTIEKDKTR